MTHTYSFNDKTLSITDLDYRYSMGSDVHTVSLTLHEGEKTEKSTFHLAIHGQDLEQAYDGEPKKQIDRMEILAMRMASRVISTLIPELSGRYALGKRYTYHPATLTVDGTNIYYCSRDNRNHALPRDFGVLIKTLDQCFLAAQGYCKGQPTLILPRASVVPLKKMA